jgi:acetylornithine deacetylase
MIEVIRRELPAPAFVVVGEPTSMEAVSGHKGIATFHVTVTGREVHSSQPHLGVSAVMEAVKLMSSLGALADRLQAEADPASPFTPKGPTLTIGIVHGGTAHNILARECHFVFDVRSPGPATPQDIIAPFLAEAAELDRVLKARAPEAGVSVEMRTNVPPFRPEADGAAEAFARRMTGDNGPPRVVAFAAEAGQFQQAGFSTVICGPGSIEQAHQPDEFVELSQMQRGAAFMRRLIDWSVEPEL